MLMMAPCGAPAQSRPVPADAAAAIRAAQGAACVPGNSSPSCGTLANGSAGGVGVGLRGGAGAYAATPRADRAPTSTAQLEAQRAAQRAALGDQYGGRAIPPQILKILADPRIDPITAYLVWQAARKPLDDWTLTQLQDITATLPTLAETGMPISDIQALYQFLGLDPGDIFNPQLGQDWQTGSTRFDPNSAGAVAAISSADCQADPGQMTVATYRSCNAGGQ
jgi:hypothetical protein